MLSRLAVGYGSWTGHATHGESRREGPSGARPGTVGHSRPHADQPAEAGRTGAAFPKTYLTRKGALILFSSRENHEQREPTTQSTEAKEASLVEQLHTTLGTGNIAKLFSAQTSSIEQHQIGLAGSSRSAGQPARRRQCRSMAVEHDAPDLAAYIAEVKSSMRRRHNLHGDDLGVPLSHRDWPSSGTFPAVTSLECTEGQNERPSTALSDYTAFSPVPLHQLTLVPASSLKTAALSESWINYIMADKINRVKAASAGRQLKRRCRSDARPTSSREPDRDGLQLLSASWQASQGVLRPSHSSLPRNAHACDQQPAPAEVCLGRPQLQKLRTKTNKAGLENCKASECPRVEAGEPITAGTEYESDSALFVEEDIVLPAGSESCDTYVPLDTDARLTTTPESRSSKADIDYSHTFETWPNAGEPMQPVSTMHTSILPVADNVSAEDHRASSLALTTVPVLESYYEEATHASDLLHEATADSRLVQHSWVPNAARDTVASIEELPNVTQSSVVVMHNQHDEDHGHVRQFDLSTSAHSSRIDGVLASETPTSSLPLHNQIMSSRRLYSSRDPIAAAGSRGGEARDGNTGPVQSGLVQQRQDHNSGIQLEHFSHAAGTETSQVKLPDMSSSLPLYSAAGQLSDTQASLNQFSNYRSDNHLQADETTGYSQGSTRSRTTMHPTPKEQQQPEGILQQMHNNHDGRVGSEALASPAQHSKTKGTESSSSDSGIGFLPVAKVIAAVSVLPSLTKAVSSTNDTLRQSLGVVGSREPQKTMLGRALLPDGTGSSYASSKFVTASSLNSHTLETDSLSRNSAITQEASSQSQSILLQSTSSRCLGGDPSNGMTIDKPKKSRKKDARSRKVVPPPSADAAFDASLAANSVDDDYVMPSYVSNLLSRPMIQLSDAVSADELAVVEETLRLKLEEATSQLAVEPALRATTAAQQDGHRSGTSRNKKPKRSALSADARSSSQLEEIAAKREVARRRAQKEKAERRAEQDKLNALVSELKDRHGSARASASDRLARLREEESAALAAIQELQTEEDEARRALARARETSRDERESRRQNEDQHARLAKTKQLAEQRQLERVARQKQLTLLESIVEPEAMSRLWAEERRREEEDEWREEQRQEEEERRAMVEAEEEEARIAEIEKRAEEEAMQSIMAHRAAADKALSDIQLQIKQLLGELEQQRKAMEADEERLMERLRAFLEEERLKEEEDRRRAQTMARLEQETRDRLRQEAELRRQHIMALRKRNLDAKANLSTIRRNQGINKSWVFSYYVRWPREMQERLIGADSSEGSLDQQQLSALS